MKFLNGTKFKEFSKKWLLWQILIFVLIIALDQITKSIVENNLVLDKPVTFIKGFMDFRYVRNEGAAFGMLDGARWFFVALTVVVVPFMIWMTIKFRRFGKFYTYTMAVVIAGAFGNMIDRVIFGYVRDFFEFTFFDFAIFNVADIALSVGAVMLIVYLLFFCEELKTKPKTVENISANSDNVEDENKDDKQ